MIRTIRRQVVQVLISASVLTAVVAQAQDAPAVRLNVDRARVMAHGYDVVAYFTDRKPVQGVPSFEFVWQGATWRFASADHRDRFAKAPESFAPQYGGFCAWAVSRGSTADTDPEAWTIVNGRLFLNYSKSVQKQWEIDRDANITRADSNWPALSRQK